MPFEFKLPDLGEGIHEAQIIALKIAEGDTVKEDQPIMEVETDKAAVEIPVPRAGRISRLMVKAGDTVKVGQVLVVVDDGSAAAAPSAAPVAASAKSAAAPAAQARATGASGVTAPPQPPAPARQSAGDGAIKAAASAAVAAPRVAPPPPITPAAPASTAVIHKGPVPAAPATRRYARERGVDLRMVPGSGPGGRVTQEDVDGYMNGGGGSATQAVANDAPESHDDRQHSQPQTAAPRAQVPHAQAPHAASAAPPPPHSAEAMPDFSQWGPIKREPVPQIRKAIARQMMRAWQNVPRVTHGDEADLTDLEAFRKQHGETVAEAGGGKLTITAFVLKALAATLREHPKMNCSYDGAAEEVIWKQYIHLGVAVDSPRGLIVPVLRDVDKKSLSQISKDLTDLSARIRDGKFDIAELRGGTFTLSNVGALGGTFSTPMVNYPETAILVTGRLAKKAVVTKDDRIVPRLMMPLSLSFDHRIIDGADAARFSKSLMEYLQNPIKLLVSA